MAPADIRDAFRAFMRSIAIYEQPPTARSLWLTRYRVARQSVEQARWWLDRAISDGKHVTREEALATCHIARQKAGGGPAAPDALNVIIDNMIGDPLSRKLARSGCLDGDHLELHVDEQGDAETGPIVYWMCIHCGAHGRSRMG